MNFEIVQDPPVSDVGQRRFAPSGFPHDFAGLVVKFESDRGQRLLGNFRRGSGAYDTVIRHPNGLESIVIAGGWAYLIDPASPDGTRLFRGDVIGAYLAPCSRFIVLMYGEERRFGFSLEAIDSTGSRWLTGTCRCVGFKDISVDSHQVTGVVQEDLNTPWIPFDVSLETGRTRGVSFVKLGGVVVESPGVNPAGEHSH